MSKWPESAVAIALILLIAAVSVAGIARYHVDEFLRIWAALTGLIGIITGAIVTYFFTRSSLDHSERKLGEAERKLELERERSRALLSADLGSHRSTEDKSEAAALKDRFNKWTDTTQRALN
jgi:hypothetical protein